MLCVCAAEEKKAGTSMKVTVKQFVKIKHTKLPSVCLPSTTQKTRPECQQRRQQFQWLQCTSALSTFRSDSWAKVNFACTQHRCEWNNKNEHRQHKMAMSEMPWSDSYLFWLLRTCTVPEHSWKLPEICLRFQSRKSTRHYAKKERKKHVSDPPHLSHLLLFLLYSSHLCRNIPYCPLQCKHARGSGFRVFIVDPFCWKIRLPIWQQCYSVTLVACWWRAISWSSYYLPY